jgi:hypothetical protein
MPTPDARVPEDVLPRITANHWWRTRTFFELRRASAAQCGDWDAAAMWEEQLFVGDHAVAMLDLELAALRDGRSCDSSPK